MKMSSTSAVGQVQALSKADRLREMGIDPYPARAFEASMKIGAALLDSDNLVASREVLRFAGRMTGVRNIGRTWFIDLVHDSERLQAMVRENGGDDSTRHILRLLEVGDFIGVEGKLFRTRKGETTLAADSFVILGKCLRSPPLGKRSSNGDVFHALNDSARLLRDRHIALQTDRALRSRVLLRAHILRTIRGYFETEGFVEVETPILSEAYGGAAARPFVTRSHSLGADLYLRVSPEPHLKRILCGDLPRIFEIGKNFRNEGIDHSHNPEFTAIEWYEAFTDYNVQMARFETLVSMLAIEVTGSYLVRFKDIQLDFEPPWPRISVLHAVAAELDVPPADVTIDLLRSTWHERLGSGKPFPKTWGEGLMAFFEEFAEAQIRGPAFIIDQPVEVSPLTKRHRSDYRLVERFEPFVAGLEIGNAYSELNDPVEQRRRLAEQDLLRDEKYGLDEAFLRAMEDGMPQAGGAGMGIDRIVMILTGADRLSDVILFPAQRSTLLGLATEVDAVSE